MGDKIKKLSYVECSNDKEKKEKSFKKKKEASKIRNFFEAKH